MLSELFIRNFAIIDNLRMQFAPGFNVLTGETGAGKSIILDAVNLVLGGRADSSIVRAGHDKAFVEATFRLNSVLQATLVPLLEAEGLDEQFGDEILLARELRTNGRNICRINGRTVNVNLLRQISEPLIDIHGQGEHLSLLKPKSHLPLLDSYAKLEKERNAVAVEVHKVHAVHSELIDLRRDERLMAQRIDMLQFQIEEISAANLKDGEEEELRQERTRLANSEQLARNVGEAIALIAGMEDDEATIVDMLGQAERALSQVAKLDESKAALLENLQGLTFQLNELAAEAQDYQGSLEFDPQRLDEVEERLELLHTLKRKYGDSVAEILAVEARAVVELDQISNSAERITALENETEKLLHTIGQLGDALSQKRQAAAQALAQAVEQQLGDLHMKGARFAVEFSRESRVDGAYVDVGGQVDRFAYDQTGIDKGEFVISANPGEPLKPMAKVASGGETARLMLALKTALAAVDATPTLIFDEIDQGIGGRVGDVVGRKLWGLTAVGNHQVIVVTHLPQLAGYGDIHFHVSKHVVNQRTTTSVQNLDVSGRIKELAAMLGTDGETAVSGAQSILNRVQQTKKLTIAN
ncbi:MAG: DNA repair protein RecN [Anaerolineales bacterium]|nr:DNA repair protein RecN [Anaerolineales bacterium]